MVVLGWRHHDCSCFMDVQIKLLGKAGIEVRISFIQIPKVIFWIQLHFCLGQFNKYRMICLFERPRFLLFIYLLEFLQPSFNFGRSNPLFFSHLTAISTVQGYIQKNKHTSNIFDYCFFLPNTLCVKLKHMPRILFTSLIIVQLSQLCNVIMTFLKVVQCISIKYKPF